MDSFKSRNLVFTLFCLGNITISFNFAALAAAIPAIARDLQLSEMDVSQILPYYMIPYGIGALVYAYLAKRFNFKIILTGIMMVYALTSLLCAVTQSLGVLIVSRALMGFAAGGVTPIALMLIGRNFPKETRGRLVGWFFSASFIASVLGIVCSGFFSWHWLFVVPAVSGVIAALILVVQSEPVLNQLESGTLNYFEVFKNGKMRNVFIFIFFISFLFHGVHKWFGVYLSREYGFDQFWISFYFVLIAVAGAVGQNLGGYLTDKKGRVAACLSGVSILSVSTMLLVGHYHPFFLAIVLIAFSIGWTIGHNGVSTVLTDFPDERRAEVAGLNSSLRFLSGGLGFFVGGPLVEKNFGLTFFGFGILMLVSSIFLKRIIPATQ